MQRQKEQLFILLCTYAGGTHDLLYWYGIDLTTARTSDEETQQQLSPSFEVPAETFDEVKNFSCVSCDSKIFVIGGEKYRANSYLVARNGNGIRNRSCAVYCANLIQGRGKPVWSKHTDMLQHRAPPVALAFDGWIFVFGYRSVAGKRFMEKPWAEAFQVSSKHGNSVQTKRLPDFPSLYNPTDFIYMPAVFDHPTTHDKCIFLGISCSDYPGRLVILYFNVVSWSWGFQFIGDCIEHHDRELIDVPTSPPNSPGCFSKLWPCVPFYDYWVSRAVVTSDGVLYAYNTQTLYAFNLHKQSCHLMPVFGLQDFLSKLPDQGYVVQTGGQKLCILCYLPFNKEPSARYASKLRVDCLQFDVTRLLFGHDFDSVLAYNVSRTPTYTIKGHRPAACLVLDHLIGPPKNQEKEEEDSPPPQKKRCETE